MNAFWSNAQFAVVLTFCVPLAATAQELWQGATYGMTRAQVQALFPDATQSGDDKATSTGAKCRLDLPNVVVVDAPFLAHFYFSDRDGLEKVELEWQRRGPSSAALAPLFDRLVEALSARYGKPIELNRSSEFFNAAQWTTGKIRIVFWAWGGPPEGQHYSIHYVLRDIPKSRPRTNKDLLQEKL